MTFCLHVSAASAGNCCNVIETVDAQRLSSDSNATTGALFSDAPITDGLDVTPTGTGAAIYYSASYYDADDRDIADENVGTNGGSVWTRPSTPDSSDATHLVTTYGYDAAGNQDTITDPAGLVTQSYFDALGRTTETIADYADGTPTDDSNQTTEYTYDGDSNTLTQTAVMPSGTPNQTTAYVYGVTTTGGSAIDSNDLLAKVEYPDPTTGDASTSAGNDDSYTYDALGETLTETDQNGTKHTFAYDTQGREISDTATVASGNPENIDTSVVELGYSYNNQGLAFEQTSYNSSDGIVNQDEELYNGLGQLTNQYQSVSGAVNTSSTPDTQYVYDTDEDGNPIDGSRQIEMIYPDGRILHYGYDNSSLDDAISRVDYQADDNGSGGVGSHLADYEYQGLSTIVQQTDGNGVTETISLDQFGRTAEIKYLNSDSVTTDDFQYGYDQDGNVLYEDNTVDPSLSNLYTYDGLNRVTSDDQGTLNDDDNAIVGTPTTSQSWTYDALGNQIAVTTNGTEVDSAVNSQNELTENGTSSLAYDYDGNTTTDESGDTDVYDAWNRLVAVKSGSTTIAAYTYDAGGWRITETHGSTATDVYFDAQGQVIEQRQGSTVTAQNVFSLQYVNDLVEEDQGSSRYYYQQDANYNVTAITDTSGNVLERYTYDAYGAVTVLNVDGSVKGDGTIASSGYGTIYLFQGGRLDPVTGLYKFGARDYDPSTGRWREQDPAGYVNGVNTYQMELSSPASMTDPRGLDAAATESSRTQIANDVRTIMAEQTTIDALNHSIAADNAYIQKGQSLIASDQKDIAQNMKVISKLQGYKDLLHHINYVFAIGGAVNICAATRYAAWGSLGWWGPLIAVTTLNNAAVQDATAAEIKDIQKDNAAFQQDAANIQALIQSAQGDASEDQDSIEAAKEQIDNSKSEIGNLLSQVDDPDYSNQVKASLQKLSNDSSKGSN